MLEILGMGMDIMWAILSIQIPLTSNTEVTIWQIFIYAIILAIILKQIKKIGDGEKSGK